MPKRSDLKKILVVGSGPVTVGQACEFDYAADQSCRALIKEGYELVLINSDPATVITDPSLAARTYIEPITPEVVAKIIRRERPDALLTTVGGQTALNVAAALARSGVCERYGVELIGCDLSVIEAAEDRRKFKDAMLEIGLPIPASGIARSVDEGIALIPGIGYPVIVRPSFALAGTGGSTIYNMEEASGLLEKGLKASSIHEVLVEESLMGWKEFEFEVLRDSYGNVVVVTGMENLDPMGVHTGDSAGVIPPQTLSSEQYARYADYCRRAAARIGVKGSAVTIQFAGNADGRVCIIEVNPRLSRTSAAASKATAIPIARIAAKLAIGYTLDEVFDRAKARSFETTGAKMDWVACKLPRFAFDKFPDAERTINTSMKSVGEAMSIGRNFKEAFQKALRSLEIGRGGFGADGQDPVGLPDEGRIIEKLATPNDERFFYIRYALLKGFSIDRVYDLTKIDRWFLSNFRQLLDLEAEIAACRRVEALGRELLRQAKLWGFSDRQIGFLTGAEEASVRRQRRELGVQPEFGLACAGEGYAGSRPCFYSTYDQIPATAVVHGKKIVILGSGPNRIGQGIEFDHSCVHAAMAVRAEGAQAIIIGCNPRSVSTGGEISDGLYFEALTAEDVLNVLDREKPSGVMLQFGGTTPLKLMTALEESGVPVLGTGFRDMQITEHPDRMRALLSQLGLGHCAGGTGASNEEVSAIANRAEYPVLLLSPTRRIIYDDQALMGYLRETGGADSDRPVSLEHLLEEAVTAEVDAISDGRDAFIAAIMEQIEPAGINTGDSAAVIPPQSLSPEVCAEIDRQTRALCRALNVVGLLNVQFAVQGRDIYVLAARARASRTVPFVSKAVGVPLAQMAAKVMLGRTLRDLGLTREYKPTHVAVKESVFPFSRFAGVDTQLGPEMKSTGEVMGMADDFGMAFAKAQISAGQILPGTGVVFISLMDKDKGDTAAEVARLLAYLGFRLLATGGTARFLRKNGIECERVNKIREGRPHIVDKIIDGQIALVINTPSGKNPARDSAAIRSNSWARGIPIVTTLQGAIATGEALKRMKQTEMTVKTLQEYGVGPR